MARPFVGTLAATIAATLVSSTYADLPNLISGIEMNCVEEGDREHPDWTGNCTTARMDADLFFLPHDLEYPARRDIVDFLRLAEKEPVAAGFADMVMEKLQLLNLQPAQHPSARDPDPDWIFALPSRRDAFCQFGYVPVTEREETENTWQDWRRFRCYIDIGQDYLVYDFTPKSWQQSTSYFVSLIHVLLSR